MGGPTIIFSKTETRRQALKTLTALTIKQRKESVNLQAKKNFEYVKRAKIKEVLSFLGASQFLLCVRFVENATFKKPDFTSILTSFSAEWVSVDGTESSKLLAFTLEGLPLEIAEILSSNAIFLIRVPSADLLTRLTKKLISVEEDLELNALLSTQFIRDGALLLDLALIEGSKSTARIFYKSYDSRESILLELLQTNFGVLKAVTNLFDSEANTVSSLCSPSQNWISWL